MAPERDDERSLDLSFETLGRGEKEERVARICVASARGFTRNGSAAVITSNCHGAEALEREVERLKAELDDALDRGRQIFGASPAARAQGPRAKASEPSTGKSKLPSTLTVADAMTRDVKTVGENDRISVADQLMKLGRFRHLVVLGEDRAVVGVVSQRDIVFGALAWSLGIGKRAHQSALEAYPVKEVMATSVVSVDPATPLADAAALMMQRKIGCLPVLAGERLVGILTEGDFLALLSA
jgi:CBS domain-containing protein